ncbi:hypothetical protein NEDG_00378 [Nematocida displodere]|uniref:Uncharacterized protein n=1 Tax=Nematocida displodere TaxID=1805483 RepID=A0A177EIV6_9MICR|nr:hypothetical protein NEDG_00378 [Nematocida displodere]
MKERTDSGASGRSGPGKSPQNISSGINLELLEMEKLLEINYSFQKEKDAGLAVLRRDKEEKSRFNAISGLLTVERRKTPPNSLLIAKLATLLDASSTIQQTATKLSMEMGFLSAQRAHLYFESLIEQYNALKVCMDLPHASPQQVHQFGDCVSRRESLLRHHQEEILAIKGSTEKLRSLVAEYFRGVDRIAALLSDPGLAEDVRNCVQNKVLVKGCTVREEMVQFSMECGVLGGLGVLVVLMGFYIQRTLGHLKVLNRLLFFLPNWVIGVFVQVCTTTSGLVLSFDLKLFICSVLSIAQGVRSPTFRAYNLSAWVSLWILKAGCFFACWGLALVFFYLLYTQVERSSLYLLEKASFLGFLGLSGCRVLNLIFKVFTRRKHRFWNGTVATAVSAFGAVVVAGVWWSG